MGKHKKVRAGDAGEASEDVDQVVADNHRVGVASVGRLVVRDREGHIGPVVARKMVHVNMVGEACRHVRKRRILLASKHNHVVADDDCRVKETW